MHLQICVDIVCRKYRLMVISFEEATQSPVTFFSVFSVLKLIKTNFKKFFS